MTVSEDTGGGHDHQTNEATGKSRRAGRRRGVALVGLKRARARSGLTLDEVAARTGLNRTTVNQLENLRNRADLRTMYALAQALEVPEEELTGEQQEK